MTGEKNGEFRGKTIEAAISAGLAALRVSRDAVEVEILRPGSRGVLGIGAEDAVVRLTVLRPARPEPLTAARPAPKPEAKLAPKPELGPEPKPEPKPAAKAPQPAPVSPALPAASDKDSTALELGRDFLAGLLERMNLRAEIEIVPQSDHEADDDDRMQVLNIVGDDLGVLIGRQNETLSALEFITRLMVNQQSRARSSFIIDVNGYRAKRAESLHKLALRMAEQVQQTGRTMALEPMTPAERRIIHLALRDHASVTTQSVGEGDRRKVTIIPKKE
ncbi:MAG: hypothetical protein AUK03_09005 [Anaerolineae bacterium CG2_30_64_16]|nr:MAG: hypothetical protein AUK03_09005 [Anaerolineae bacterium CG2_30_64_16]